MKTTLNSTNKEANQTMYNLHTKRTLPRDVIKWMQGLDLSYSVKDYRKDMSNGFLIGEIISRYEPGKIPMHAFENSSNQNRRDNNWNQLQLFFKKHTLRGIEISPEDYTKIKTNNDPKSDYLFNFVCHLYSICTKRTIPQNTPILDLPPTQNPNLTTSYLLRDEGLQKLQNSGLQSNNHSQLQNSGFSQKNPDRIPTRKIASNVEAGDLVDATGVGIKAEGRKLTSKRKSWNFDQQKEASGEDEENAEPERLIFDYLHSIMEECLPTEDPTIRELLFPDEARFSPTETLLRNLHSVDQEYLMSFLNQVNLNVEELCTIILREINETWKFFTYFFKLLKPLADNWEGFTLVCDLIGTYARQCHLKEPKRLSKVFYDGLLTTLINEVKLTNNMRKKYQMMGLVYDFSGRELEEKKSVLSRLKDEISSSNVLYIQWLSVLVKEQTQKEKDGRLLDDFIYYAQQYLSSSSSVSRTSALKILSQISKSHCSLVEKFFISKTSVFRNCKDDPEQVYLLIEIYFNIMEEVVESQQYQQLIKGVGSNNLVKAYNPDNEKNAQDLKNRVNTISEAIKQLCELSANPSIRQICSKKAIPFIQESKHMMQVFLDYIYASSPKSAFFNNTVTQHEFKTMTVETPGVGVSAIKDCCNQILIEIISMKTTKDYSIEQFIELINVCLENLNVKKINMEFWQDVSLHIVKPYTRLMIDLHSSKAAVQGLIKVFNIYFNFDMKIRELSQWIAQAVNHYQESWGEISSDYDNKQEAKEYIDERIDQLNEWLNGEYQRSRNQMVSFILNEISDNLSSSKQQKLIYIKN